MKPQVRTTGLSSRVATLLVLCAWCVGMGVGVPGAKADIFPPGDFGTLVPLRADWYIASDKAEYALGEQVHVEYWGVNNTSSVITLEFTSEPILYLHVLRDGGLIWDSTGGWHKWNRPLVVFDPGEVLESQFVWDQTDTDGNPVGPGEYEMRGRGGGGASTMITIVPEPSTLVLLCLGLWASGSRGRKVRR